MNKILEDHKENLVKLIPSIEKIILYGSFARKEQFFGSDVDLLFLVKERTGNDFEKIYEYLYSISLDYEWSPLIITKRRFEKRLEEGDFFINHVVKDGIIIWAENI